MNNISIMGRITADLELRYTNTNKAVLKFTVAVPRPNVKDKTDFIRCVAWEKRAEFIEKWFSKGKMIAITGILTSNAWKGDDGKYHSINEVYVASADFCGDSKGNNTPGDSKAVEVSPEPFEEVSEDELPF